MVRTIKNVDEEEHITSLNYPFVKKITNGEDNLSTRRTAFFMISSPNRNP
jgi:hypothetical protein